MTLVVLNAGAEAHTLYLRGRPVAVDLSVRRADGAPVWHRLEHAVIPAIIQLRELRPGERLAFGVTWDQMTGVGQSAGAGEFLLEASLLTDGPEPLRAPPVPLRVVGAA
jgi:hypothetical protein